MLSIIGSGRKLEIIYDYKEVESENQNAEIFVKYFQVGLFFRINKFLCSY